MVGSSPLTRGKPCRDPRRGRVRRLIPAHAGKTPAPQADGNQEQAHPRSRGENRAGARNPVMETGSSPLTRGKRFSVGAGLRIVRLIPAHAGKTTRRSSPGPPEAAHPRSRGENAAHLSRGRGERGSSPLTRGKRNIARMLQDRHGLIPAHAGKTASESSLSCTPPAHPRSRGENIQTTVQTVAGWGSSPLTRGKRGARARGNLRPRLIPAHAGKTTRRTASSR